MNYRYLRMCGKCSKDALSQSFSKVTQVTLEIGRFSNVEPEALRFCFDVVMEGSLAEDAELIIAEVDGLRVCQQCRRQLAMTTLYELVFIATALLLKLFRALK